MNSNFEATENSFQLNLVNLPHNNSCQSDSLLPPNILEFKKLKLEKKLPAKSSGPYNFTVKSGDCLNEDDNKVIYEGLVGYKLTAEIYKTTAPLGTDKKILIEIKRIKRNKSEDPLNKDLHNYNHYEINKGPDEYSMQLASLAVINSPLEVYLRDEQTKVEYEGKTVKLDTDEKGSTNLIVSRNGENLVRIGYPKKKDLDSFNINMEFLDVETLTTENERKLLLATAVTCMINMNGDILTPGQHRFWKWVGILIVIGIFVGIIVGIVYLVQYLNDQCNRPGYHCSSRKRIG